MTSIRAVLFSGLLIAVTAEIGEAHFVVLIPSRDVVTASADRTIDLQVAFTHPMEQGPAMEMDRPKRFGMIVGGKRYDLLDRLEATQLDGKTAYRCSLRVTAPGDHVFFIEPAPYWEPIERKMIVHYTKVVVNAMGAEVGWDTAIGLPVEIEPLVRPYGLWTGNVFRGVVKHNGKPVPFAEIEVEYDNHGHKVKIPGSPFVTQVIKADANGVFSYAMPRAGWWGFAALVEGDEKLPGPDGEPVEVELGGLMWIRVVDMNQTE